MQRLTFEEADVGPTIRKLLSATASEHDTSILSSGTPAASDLIGYSLNFYFSFSPVSIS